tara:strand:+ start:7965 stop:9374 length:1410 start_codon:yes stop_codon:yes gene_type:complete
MIIREILNINFDKNSIAEKAYNVFQKETIRGVKSRINKLSLGDDVNLPNEEKIKEAYEYFMGVKDLGYEMIIQNYNKKNIRGLLGALNYTSDDNESSIFMQQAEFSIALQILSSDNLWNDRFLSYFQRILLSEWNTIPVKNKSALKKLMREKIDAIDKESAFLSVRNVIDNSEYFLNKDATDKVAIALIKNKIPLSQILSLLKVNESDITYEFFTNIIHSYLQLLPADFIDEDFIESIALSLESHNKHEAYLIVFAELILDTKYRNYIESTRAKAIRYIGDPISFQNWKNSKLSNSQQLKVEMARNRLNKIINKDLLNYVFEKIFRDNIRKKYWLKFIDSIDEVYIVGSRFNKASLEGDEDKREYIKSRYKLMSSSEGTCAIIMKSKDYVFVEFSVTSNALYIYKSNDFNFNLNTLRNTSELKRTKMEICISGSIGANYNFRSSGRFIHKPKYGWEENLDAWMKRYYEN